MVFQVLLGDFFQDYYDENQWKINQRTNVNIKNQDFAQIETWSKLDFKNFFAQHFAEIRKQDAAFKNQNCSFKICRDFNQSRKYRLFPKFFDYKSMQYIDYFKIIIILLKNELKENQPKILGIYDALIAKNSGNSKLYFKHQKLNDRLCSNQCKNKQEQFLAFIIQQQKAIIRF